MRPAAENLAFGVAGVLVQTAGAGHDEALQRKAPYDRGNVFHVNVNVTLA